MKKIWEIIADVCFILGVICMAAAASLSILLADSASAGASEFAIYVVTLPLVFLIVGACLYFAGNKVCRMLGVGFTATYAIAVFGYALGHMSWSSVSPACIIIFIGSIIYAISYIFRGLLFVVDKDAAATDPEKDPKIVALLKWRDLYKQGIITEEEYNKKREALLGVKKEEKK